MFVRVCVREASHVVTCDNHEIYFDANSIVKNHDVGVMML